MSWRLYLFFVLLGFAAVVCVAAFQTDPGYMDADYYYAGGLQLAAGRGFSEPYLWNYLDDPAGLPHASHAYWMPLASILAAGGMKLFGIGSWWGARIFFLLVAGLIPALTASLAWSLSGRRELAILAGLLAVFSGYYLPFLTAVDTFGLYMFLGGVFFVLVKNIERKGVSLVLGIVAGLMHLSRTEGMLWLVMSLLAAVLILGREKPQPVKDMFLAVALILAGYLLVMAPWYIRTYRTFGTLLAPGGSKMLWLTTYDQLFSYPASRLDFTHWWQSGIEAILRVRLWAAGLNLATAFGVQSGAFLLPFILMGIWSLRKEARIRLALLVWFLIFLAMTVAFPFAGARGGFYHSGAALQIVWWALAPIGLDRLIDWGVRKRGWIKHQAVGVLHTAFVCVAVILTAFITFSRLTSWSVEAASYRQIDLFLGSSGMNADDVVMVSNPPGFHLASGNPAIALPDGFLDTLLAVADRYDAGYVILEEGSMPAGLAEIYSNPDGWAGLSYLGEVGAARVFLVQK